MTNSQQHKQADEHPAFGLATVERVCLWVLPIVFLTLIVNALRFMFLGGRGATWLQYIVVLAFAATLLLRHRFRPLVRVSIYCVLLLTFGLLGLIEWGLAGQGLLVIVFALLLAALYSLRLWVVIEVLSVAGIGIIAACYASGVLPVISNAAEVLRSPLAWLTGIVTLNIAGGTAVISYQLTRELMRRADALQISEKRFREIFDSSSDAIFIHDAATGRILDVNKTMLDMYGYTREEALGLLISEVSAPLPEYSDATVLRKLELLAVEDSTVFEWQARRKDGAVFPAEVVLKRTSIAGESGILAAVRDITERKDAERQMKHLETQLRQAQKLEAVGQLAGGVAHDFNNLLQAILGYTSLTLDAIPDDTVLRDNLQEIHAAATRAATLTRQLLAFGRRQLLDPTDLDLNEVVTGVMKMLRRLLGEHIDLHVIAGHGLGAVHADRGQIEQILMNLCVNARDAMPAGGELTIATTNASFDKAFCREHAWALPGDYVLLSVADTGHGMDEKTREHIFEPFFTTKGPGEGTGLGLATVYGIVKQHQGFISVYSEPGQGSEFKVYLPRVATERAPSGESEEESQPQPLNGTETILLAEDESQVRALAERVLVQAGYKVLAAKNGEDALQVFQAHAGEIDLVLLDVVMPKLSGPDVRERVAKTHPGLPILFVSGYSADLVHKNFMLEPGIHFISKPYSVIQLLQSVRAALDGSASSQR